MSRSHNASERTFVVVADRDVVNDGTPEVIRRSHTHGVDNFESSPEISASCLFDLSDVTRRTEGVLGIELAETTDESIESLVHEGRILISFKAEENLPTINVDVEAEVIIEVSNLDHFTTGIRRETARRLLNGCEK